MAIVDFPQDHTPATNPQQRVGGFYDKLEDVEKAAVYLTFDVIVPPKLKQGYYMVPLAAVLLPNQHVRHLGNDWTVLRISSVEPRVYCKEGYPKKHGGRTNWFYSDELEIVRSPEVAKPRD